MNKEYCALTFSIYSVQSFAFPFSIRNDVLCSIFRALLRFLRYISPSSFAMAKHTAAFHGQPSHPPLSPKTARLPGTNVGKEPLPARRPSSARSASPSAGWTSASVTSVIESSRYYAHDIPIGGQSTHDDYCNTPHAARMYTNYDAFRMYQNHQILTPNGLIPRQFYLAPRIAAAANFAERQKGPAPTRPTTSGWIHGIDDTASAAVASDRIFEVAESLQNTMSTFLTFGRSDAVVFGLLLLVKHLYA